MHLAACHGASNARVLGSGLRGEEGPDSDIDLLVDAGRDTSAFSLGGLVADLEDLLGRRVHVVTESALSSYIRDRMLHEAAALLKTTLCTCC